MFHTIIANIKLNMCINEKKVLLGCVHMHAVINHAAFLYMLAISCHQIHKLSLQASKLSECGDKDACMSS